MNDKNEKPSEDELSMFIEPNLLLEDDSSVKDIGILDRLRPFKEDGLIRKLKILPKLSNAFQKQISEIEPKPAECEIEFGLSFTAEGNIYVVGIESQTTFKVKLKWN